jgi:16S rRNA (adenine1518-N6/adenine1519-N6)-dimethyltransferase
LPRKLGQHFLVRDTILERLAVAACGEHAARVIEIGPGRGALTRHLLPRTDELHAIEIDPSLADYLHSRFSGEAKLHIHRSDVLRTDLAQWGAAAIAGNLPYYITSPIVEKFLALDARFPVAVLLMQREVAERILAGPGTRAYGYLTVAVRLVCDVQLVAEAPPAAFVPPPKVDSAAIRFVRKAEAPDALPQLLAFVGRCFAQKRKTLRNNLRPFYGAAIDTLPEAPLRAEQLGIPQFLALYSKLAAEEFRFPSVH